MLDLAGGDALDHRHIGIWLGVEQRRPVGLQEEAGQEECGALVAIRQRMVARQALQQDRGLLQDTQVDLNIAEASSRRRERRLREADVGEARYLLWRSAEDVRGDVAEVPELRVVDRHGLLLAQATQRLAMLLREPAALLGALPLSAWETAREIPALGMWWRHLRRGSALGSRGAHAQIVIGRRRLSVAA